MIKHRPLGVVASLLSIFNRQKHSLGSSDIQDLPEVIGCKFLYFGFGSNMLAHRIHIQNPTAMRLGPARLPGYRLDFASFSSRWEGAVATIVPTQRDEVWGSLWEIDLSKLPDMDNWVLYGASTSLKLST
nr:gamma-glutamylcyclotransferase-like isoform X2 [Drosophila kikkawai]